MAELEFFDPSLFDEEMDVAGGVAEEEGALEEGEAAQQEAVKSFQQNALESATKFKDWVMSSLKGLTVEKVVAVGMGVMMIYDLVEKHAAQAAQTGNRVKLSAAITGVQTVLEDKYTTTVQQAAIDTINDTTTFNGLDPDTQKAVKEAAAESGKVYWIVSGPEVMKILAESPIYDPS